MFARRLCGEIIHRYEAKGFRLAGLEMQILSEDLAAQHSEETARREIARYFDDGELWNYAMPDQAWLHET